MSEFLLPQTIKKRIVEIHRSQGFVLPEDIENLCFYFDIPMEEALIEGISSFCADNNLEIREGMIEETPMDRLLMELTLIFENEGVLYFEDIQRRLRNPEFKFLELMEVIIRLTQKNIPVGQPSNPLEGGQNFGGNSQALNSQMGNMRELDEGDDFLEETNAQPAGFSDIKELFFKDQEGASPHPPKESSPTELWDHLPPFEPLENESFSGEDLQEEKALKRLEPVILDRQLTQMPEFFTPEVVEQLVEKKVDPTPVFCHWLQEKVLSNSNPKGATPSLNPFTLHGLYLGMGEGELNFLEVVLFLTYPEVLLADLPRKQLQNSEKIKKATPQGMSISQGGKKSMGISNPIGEKMEFVGVTLKSYAHPTLWHLLLGLGFLISTLSLTLVLMSS